MLNLFSPSFCVREVSGDGRDMGEMKGGMTGEIKQSEALCLKDFQQFDGRDGELFAISGSYCPIRYPYFSITATY